VREMYTNRKKATADRQSCNTRRRVSRLPMPQPASSGSWHNQHPASQPARVKKVSVLWEGARKDCLSAGASQPVFRIQVEGDHFQGRFAGAVRPSPVLPSQQVSIHVHDRR
jgi:autotransporter translocation and assembly factor TamB